MKRVKVILTGLITLLFLGVFSFLIGAEIWEIANSMPFIEVGRMSTLVGIVIFSFIIVTVHVLI